MDCNLYTEINCLLLQVAFGEGVLSQQEQENQSRNHLQLIKTLANLLNVELSSVLTWSDFSW